MLLPALVQRQIGPAGVLAGVRPGRVAMSGEKKLWQIGCHGVTPCEVAMK
jgi:hypothetical protein